MDKTKLYKLAKLVMKFKEVESDKGKLIIDGEIAEGVAVDMLDENEEVIPAADGEYEVEGVKFIVKDGAIESVAEAEEPEAEPAEEPQKEEAEAEEPEAEPAEEPSNEPDEKDAKIEELTAKCAELEAQLAEANARIAELEGELNKPVDEPVQMKAVAHQPIFNVQNNALKYFTK